MKPLIETIKIIDGVPLNMKWHRERCDRAMANHFRSDKRIDLDRIIGVEPVAEKGVMRCKITYGNGDSIIELFDYKPKSIRRLRMVMVDDIDYQYKYADRDCFNRLLGSCADYDEIIIVKDGFVTDTTISNIALYDGKEWVTPNTYLLNGTARQRLIYEGRLKEKEVKGQDICKFQSIKLINAMLDFDESQIVEICNVEW